MNKIKIKIASINIPDDSSFPDRYRNGIIEVGVWPPVGVMTPVLDCEGGPERLREWAINNVLRGWIEGDYDEAFLREQVAFVKILSRQGDVLLDTFVWKDTYEPDVTIDL